MTLGALGGGRDGAAFNPRFFHFSSNTTFPITAKSSIISTLPLLNAVLSLENIPNPPLNPKISAIILAACTATSGGGQDWVLGKHLESCLGSFPVCTTEFATTCYCITTGNVCTCISTTTCLVSALLATSSAACASIRRFSFDYRRDAAVCWEQTVPRWSTLICIKQITDQHRQDKTFRRFHFHCYNKESKDCQRWHLV